MGFKGIKADRLRFNYKAFDRLRKSTEVMGFVESIAKDQMNGSRGLYNVKSLKKRGSVLISCRNKATVDDNKKSHELIKRIKNRRRK